MEKVSRAFWGNSRVCAHLFRPIPMQRPVKGRFDLYLAVACVGIIVSLVVVFFFVAIIKWTYLHRMHLSSRFGVARHYPRRIALKGLRFVEMLRERLEGNSSPQTLRGDLWADRGSLRRRGDRGCERAKRSGRKPIGRDMLLRRLSAPAGLSTRPAAEPIMLSACA